MSEAEEIEEAAGRVIDKLEIEIGQLEIEIGQLKARVRELEDGRPYRDTVRANGQLISERDQLKARVAELVESLHEAENIAPTWAELDNLHAKLKAKTEQCEAWELAAEAVTHELELYLESCPDCDREPSQGDLDDIAALDLISKARALEAKPETKGGS